MSKQVVKVRVTAHRGRSGRNGAYNPKHNDRNFDVRKSDHIDMAKSTENMYWHCYRQTIPNMTFEDAESKFYEEYFSDALSQKNARYIKNRHKERIQTMEVYRKSERYCPEEIIYQLGEVSQQRPSSNTLIQIINEYNRWQRSLWYEKRNVVRISVLTMALHRDEPNAADHVHIRQVYMVKNKDGHWEVNQEQALKKMGIELSNPNEEKGRYNNRKKAFTEMARNKFVEIAKSRGVQIIEDPKDPSQSGLDLLEYKVQKEKEKLIAAKEQLDRLYEDTKFQDAKVKERDDYVKEFFPDIWEMANDYTTKDLCWENKKTEKKNKFINLER